jgi:hypothetical protein
MSHLSPDCAKAKEWTPGILVPVIASRLIVKGGICPYCEKALRLRKTMKRMQFIFLNLFIIFVRI